MTEAALREQMKKDNAIIDMKKGPCHFKQCRSCSENFGLSLKPALLDCGHFICQAEQCLKRKLCSQCDKPLKVKKNPYQPLLSFLKFYQQKRTENNQQKLYNFIISSTDGKYSQHLYNKSQDQTLKHLINSYFKDQIDRLADSAQDGISINGLSYNYTTVQAKTIKEYNSFLSAKKKQKNKLFTNTGKPNTNQIRFSQLYLGGNKL